MKMTSFTLAILALSLIGCSLDSEYFQATRVNSYTLGTEVIDSGNIDTSPTFTSNGQTLYGVFVTAKNGFNANTKTILYFHGRDKNIDKYWERVGHLYDLDVNIFIFDYQGYGRSTGSPSLAGLRQNSRDALTYLKTRNDVNTDKIVFYAYSFGGIFALDVAANMEEPMGLITENIPANSEQILANSLTVKVPGSFVFDETFDSVKDMQGISAPKLMFHAKNDETVPFSHHARQIFKAASAPKTERPVENAKHSTLIDTLTENTYRDEITTFLNDL